MLLFQALYHQWNVESDYNIFNEIFFITLTWLICNSTINFVWILNGTIVTNGQYLTINNLRWYNFVIFLSRSTICILISTCKNVYDTFVMDQMVLRPPDENALDDLEMILHNTSALEYFYDYLKNMDEQQKNGGPGTDYYGMDTVHIPTGTDSERPTVRKANNDSMEVNSYQYNSMDVKAQQNLLSPGLPDQGATPSAGANFEVVSKGTTIDNYQSKFNLLCFYMDIRCYDSEIRKVREIRAFMR
jgi:hypothetical protein